MNLSFKLLVLITLVLFGNALFAQSSPELGPNSLTLPRLTSVQRNALSPVKGNIIFNTSSNQMEYYDGTSWKTYVSGTSYGYSIYPNNNISIGGTIFQNLTTGARNYAFSDKGLSQVSSGTANSSLGDNALSVNSTGDGNTAIGSQALKIVPHLQIIQP